MTKSLGEAEDAQSAAEAAIAAAVRTLEKVEMPLGLGVGGAALDVVGGEALPQGVHVLRLALVRLAHIALETRH